MKVRIWGARGSLPTPMSNAQLLQKQRLLLQEASPEDIASPEAIEAYLDRSSHARTYGGNTSCVEVSVAGKTLILDAGSGIKALSDALFAEGRALKDELALCLTHFHWDHICGLPFFGPVYVPKRKLDIWSWREAEDTDRLLSIQMNDAHFPMKWEQLGSERVCHQFDVDGTNEVMGFSIRCLKMNHPDGAYGYRVEHEGHAVCYITDTEVSKTPEEFAAAYAGFVEGADLVIVDAMYGFLEYHEHYDFGHSSVFTWIDFFRESGIGELVVFHHDPTADDQTLDKLVDSGARYRELVAKDAPWTLSVAREGQTWQLGD